MHNRPTHHSWLFGAAIIVVGLGAIEGWYGRFDYGADGIAYLDLSQAVGQGDWRHAMSPYWSVGYPAILALGRGFFPAGPLGEWTALRVVNLTCWLGAYLSFLFFLSTSMRYAAWHEKQASAGTGQIFIYVIGTAFYLLFEINYGCVSRVSPDLLVSGIFFLAAAYSLRAVIKPSTVDLFLLGGVLGFGYVVKGFFLLLSGAIIGLLILHILWRHRSDRGVALAKLAWTALGFLVWAIPLIAATSAVLGRFTLGETGALNYAWSVNHLPHGTQWQGGPPPFGNPIHPTQMLMRNPPVFAFDEPYHVTYPPLYDQFYWYDGYHDFFRLRNQVDALKTGFLDVLKTFTPGPHLVVKGIAEIVILLSWLCFIPRRRLQWARRFLGLWPVYLPALVAIFLYAMVVVEPRYIVAFLIVLAVLPFLALYVPTELSGRKVGYAVMVAVILVAATVIAREKTTMFRRALHNEVYTTDAQWQEGAYLSRIGVRPGDRLATVGVSEAAVYCTFAHVIGAHIVAQLGNGTFDPDNQEQDFALFADHPDVQQQVFDAFKQKGVVMVLALEVKRPLRGPGWEQVPGTDMWLHRLP